MEQLKITWEELESRSLPWTKKESLKEWGDMGYLARCKYESYEAYDISRHESLLLEYIRKYQSLYPLHPPMDWERILDSVIDPDWGYDQANQQYDAGKEFDAFVTGFKQTMAYVLRSLNKYYPKSEQ